MKSKIALVLILLSVSYIVSKPSDESQEVINNDLSIKTQIEEEFIFKELKKKHLPKEKITNSVKSLLKNKKASKKVLAMSALGKALKSNELNEEEKEELTEHVINMYQDMDFVTKKNMRISLLETLVTSNSESAHAFIHEELSRNKGNIRLVSAVITKIKESENPQKFQEIIAQSRAILKENIKYIVPIIPIQDLAPKNADEHISSYFHSYQVSSLKSKLEEI
jgi:hypothetical protein